MKTFFARRSRLAWLVVSVVLFGWLRRCQVTHYDANGYRWIAVRVWPFKRVVCAVSDVEWESFQVTDSEGRDCGHFPSSWLDKKAKQ